MKITKRQLRKIIKEEIDDEYGKDYLSHTHEDGEGEEADPALDFDGGSSGTTLLMPHSHGSHVANRDREYYDESTLVMKQRLHPIIQQEKCGMLGESVTDMSQYEPVTNRMGMEIAGIFTNDMYELFSDIDAQDSGMFRGVGEGEWLDQLDAAKMQLADAIAMAIEDEIKNTELLLHDGQFARPPKGNR